MKKVMTVIFVVLLLLVVKNEAISQCAMCRQTAESASTGTNEGIAQGLNSGIVYLMLAPYLLILIGAIALFRKKIFGFITTK
jgi:hypothetical protein